MNVNRRTIRLWLTVGIAACATIIAVTRLTDAFQLTTVTYNGDEVADFDDRFGLNDSASVFEQPLDSLAKSLLARKNVFRVDIDVDIPHEVELRTNNFKPVCYMVDKNSGQMFGLTHDARVISLATAERDWENPIICGIESAGLYRRCRDHRVTGVIDELIKLEERNSDLYRLVDEINLSSADHARIVLAGLPYRLKVRPEYLASDIVRIADFVTNYQRELDSVKVIDLRFDDMIVTSRGGR